MCGEGGPCLWGMLMLCVLFDAMIKHTMVVPQSEAGVAINFYIGVNRYHFSDRLCLPAI